MQSLNTNPEEFQKFLGPLEQEGKDKEERNWKKKEELRKIKEKISVCESAQIKISSWWKMVCTRKAYLEQRRKVILLQSNIRRSQTRRQYLKIKSSALLIQRSSRSYLETKKERSLLLKDSALEIKGQEDELQKGTIKICR